MDLVGSAKPLTSIRSSVLIRKEFADERELLGPWLDFDFFVGADNHPNSDLTGANIFLETSSSDGDSRIGCFHTNTTMPAI